MSNRPTQSCRRLAAISAMLAALLGAWPALAQTRESQNWPRVPRTQPVAPVRPAQPEVRSPREVPPDIRRPSRQQGPVEPPADVRRPAKPAQPPAEPPLDIRRPARPDAPQPQEPRRPEAQAPGRAARAVEVKILAIVATNSTNTVDPPLRDLAAQFRGTFKYSGYRLARTESRTVEIGKSTVLPLSGPYSIRVEPAEIAEGRVALNVQVMRQGGRDLRLRALLRPGKYQLLGGWPVGKDTLLAAVAAQPK